MTDPARRPPDGAALASSPLIHAQGIWKFFDGVPVLRGVDLRLEPGEIHALLGGNGAGKSTLMKIIAGLYVPERGVVERLGDEGSRGRHPGVYLVPQEPLLFPNLSVAENITLRLPRAPDTRERLDKLLALLDLRLDLRLPARDLDVAQQGLVEILRGLMRRARVLILDEPTSALTPKESELLFARLRRLSEGGVGLLFISHKLREIRELCSRLSVLRDGMVALQGRPQDFSDAQIVTAMTGELPSAGTDRPVRRPAAQALLELRDYAGEGFGPVSLQLHPGEVLGLAGVVGSGRTELAETVAGLRPAAGGQLSFAGQPVSRWTPRAALDAGLVYLPEDRQHHGLFLDDSIAWNTVSPVLHRERWLLDSTKIKARAAELITRLGIRCQGPDQPVRQLSGGNQQKALIAKCLACAPRALILDEPTRGVDVTARFDIYAIIDALAEEGVAVLVISSDFEEIARVCGRALIMRQGRVVRELSGVELSAETIAQASFGGSAGVVA